MYLASCWFPFFNMEFNRHFLLFISCSFYLFISIPSDSEDCDTKERNLQMTLNWVRFWPFNDRRWPRSVPPPSSTSQLQQWCALPAGWPLEGYNAGRESWMLTCRKMNRQIVEMHCLLNWCLLQLANLRWDRNMFLCTSWCGDLQIAFWKLKQINYTSEDL